MSEKFSLVHLDSELEKARTLREELHQEALEMSQIKTTFDAEKFTFGKEGEFPASRYHMLIRQYRFAVEEKERMLLEAEKIRRNRELLIKEQTRRRDGTDYTTSSPNTRRRLGNKEHLDIEIYQAESRLRSLEIDIQSKIFMIGDLEKLRQKAIADNGKPFTNEQFQAEQPAYYQWFIAKKILFDLQYYSTGVTPGVLEVHEMAAREPVLEGSKMKIESLLASAPNGLFVDLQKLMKSAIRDTDNIPTLEERKKMAPRPSPEMIHRLLAQALTEPDANRASLSPQEIPGKLNGS